MITVGDFLKSFVKYANETPNALVYTDLAPWESGESLPVNRDEVDDVLEYDQQDPKEIFFYTDTGYDDDFDGDFDED